MDDDIKAWLARFRADLSVRMDNVLDQQSLLMAQMKSLDARLESNFRQTEAAMAHYESRVDRHDARLRRLEGLDEGDE